MKYWEERKNQIGKMGFFVKFLKERGGRLAFFLSYSSRGVISKDIPQEEK